MKRLLFTLIALSFFTSNAQRRAIKNVAKTAELRQKRTELYRNHNHSVNIGFRFKISDFNYGQPYHNCVNNSANNQVFVLIPEYGNYSVELGDQYLYTYTGTFRFFDIVSGVNWIRIFKDDMLIYKAPVQVANNTRLVLEFSNQYGLYVINEQFLNRTRRPVSHGHGHDNHAHHNHYGQMPMRVSDSEFNEIKHYLKKCSFDSGRIEYIDLLRNKFFSVKDISILIKSFSFGSNRLKAVKKLYKNCVDRENYYRLLDSFTFSSEKEELSNFIKNQ